MVSRRIWIAWLSLATGVLWADTARLAAQDSRYQRHAAARVPLQEMPGGLRERVRQVVEQPTLFARGPTEAFAGRPDLYHWLLDHPDRGVLAWRRLGAKCSTINDRRGGRFNWTDEKGSEVHWETVYQGPSLRIWYAEGKLRPALLLPPLPIQIVFLLRYGDQPDEPGRTLIYHQADVFFQTDSRTAALMAKMLGPSAPRLAEQGIGQVELFFSGLIWYFDQHPERAAKLLAEGQ